MALKRLDALARCRAPNPNSLVCGARRYERRVV